MNTTPGTIEKALVGTIVFCFAIFLILLTLFGTYALIRLFLETL